jgi:PAS domain-containing protein
MPVRKFERRADRRFRWTATGCRETFSALCAISNLPSIATSYEVAYAPTTSSREYLSNMPPQTNFPAILNGMPQPYLMLNSDLTIVAASDAYLRLTDRAREDIVGRHILEAYPENPEAAGTVEQGPLEAR